MIIDSHCHLTYEPMWNALDETIDRANKDGIKFMLTISTKDESFEQILKIVTNYKSVYGTYGIHPHEANKDIVNSEFIEKSLKDNNKIIGIGETGLDFFYNNSDKDKQISSFKIHIDAAIKTNVPLIIHSREAEEETFDILNEYKNQNLKILMHCFTGSKKFAKKLLDFNTFFSASGIITFKNAKELQDTFKFLPSDKILIETDSPFLAPVPNRGKKNEPSFINFTAAKLAEIRNIDKSELIKLTTNNFNKLFQ